MTRPAAVHLTPEERTVLDLIARHERHLLTPDTAYLIRKADLTKTQREDATARLVDLGIVTWRYGEGSSSGRSYYLTDTGWLVAGDPPLHRCHPGTKENA